MSYKEIQKMCHYGNDLANKRWGTIIQNVWDKLNELSEAVNALNAEKAEKCPECAKLRGKIVVLMSERPNMILETAELRKKIDDLYKMGDKDCGTGKLSASGVSEEEIEKILEGFITHILWYHDKECGRTEDVAIIFASRFKDLAHAIKERIG